MEVSCDRLEAEAPAELLLVVVVAAVVAAGALGAATGAVVGGVSPIEGAAVGAILGGVAGAVIKGKQYYRDTRGYCYYVDQYGNPIYDYNARC